MSVVNAVSAAASRFLLQRTRTNVAAWLGYLRRPPRGVDQPRWRRRSSHLVLGVIVIAALMTATMLTFDAWEITAARQLPYPVHRFFGIITDLGKSGWFLWPTGILLLALACSARPQLGRSVQLSIAALSVRLTFVFVAIGLPGLFTSIVKNMIGRARPFVGGSANPFLYHPFEWRPAYASLPSGHTTTAVAAAVAIGALWPRSRPYLWTYALLIALSRLVITAHHPSDVVGGAVVGGLGAVLVRDWFAARRLGFVVAVDGGIHAMPGPSWRRLKEVAVRLFRK